MTSSLTSKFIASLFLISAVCSAQETLPQPVKKGQGFSHPESVVFDESRNVLFISNIGDKEPVDGFISKSDVEGNNPELRWAEGLNDPKGLLVSGDTLYAADNTELVLVNLEDGKILNKIPAEGAQFLNDVAADEAGNIYISDTRKNSIFVLPKGSSEISEWLNSEKLDNPNGLLVVDDEIYVGSWGGEELGNFLKADLETKEIQPVSTDGIGRLDGVQMTKEGEFYVSDWATGDVSKVDSLGNRQKILTSDKSAGDILYLEDQKIMVLPMNLQNEVWWYRLD